MRPARSIAAFLRDPVGRCVRGRRFLCGFPNASLQLIVGWGVITGADGEELGALIRGQTRALPRHVSLVDLRAVTSVDADALRAVAEAMLAAKAVNVGITSRGAVLRPSGVSGMSVAGFFEVVDAGYPTRVFVDPVEALRWLEHPEKSIARDLAAWDHVAAPTASELVDLARAMLASADLPSLARVARALGVSTRTLQRALGADGTTFRREVEVARIHQAEKLLLDGDRSIKEIAAHLGMTQAAFSTSFRRITGVAPTVWRASARSTTVAR